MITVTLPLPPSTNNLYFNLKNGKGRAKTTVYKDWLVDASDRCRKAYEDAGKPKCPDKVPMRLRVRVGANYTRDITNCVKPVEDALCAFLPIPDDRYNDEVSVVRCRDCEGLVVAELELLQ